MTSRPVSAMARFSSCVVQSLSHVWLIGTPWTAACQASLSITISRSLLKLMSIESVMHSNHLVLCLPLLLLPSIITCVNLIIHTYKRAFLWIMLDLKKVFHNLIWFDYIQVKFLYEHHSLRARSCHILNNNNNKPETVQAQNVISKLFADLTGKYNRNPFSSQFMRTNDKFVTKRRKFYKLRN